MKSKRCLEVDFDKSIGSQFKLDSIIVSCGFNNYIEIFDSEKLKKTVEPKVKTPWADSNEKTDLVDCLMTVFYNYRMDYLGHRQSLDIVEEALNECLDSKYSCQIYNSRPFADVIQIIVSKKRNSKNKKWVKFILVPIKK